jgi:outer membrane protein insertion porin family
VYSVLKPARVALIVAVLPAGPLAAQARAPDLAVSSVSFKGNRSIDSYTLSTAIGTSASAWTWRLFHLGERRRFDDLELKRDVLRLQLYYRQKGYFDTRVDTVVARSATSVKVTFRIEEGPPVLLEAVTVTGLDAVNGAAALRRDVSLETGKPFDRYAFEAAADTLADAVRNRGYPYAAVYRNYDVDRRTRRARVEYAVDPGPLAHIGDVVVVGNQDVATETVRRALTLRAGSLYRRDALFDSQRSLYQSGLYRYVSVGIAPDSAVGGSDSLVRVQVRVAEAAPMQMRAGAGYGTVDCFRTQANVTRLNFLGGARRLDVVARLSKIGVGEPLDLGLRRSLCSELETDPFSQQLNYYGSVTLTQPSFLARRSTMSIGAFAERRSEFNAYQVQSIGAALSLRFAFGRRVPITLGYRISNDRTDADPATYCNYFAQCDPATQSYFAVAHREASLTLSVVNSDVDAPLDPRSGRTLSLEATTARGFLGSEIVFDRLVGEVAGYYRVGRRAVLATRARAGILFLGTSTVGGLALPYVSPADRFYAGGPSTVRGFARNAMGPLVYVADSLRANPAGDTTYFGLRSSPLGSAAILLANAELRLPTPLWGGRIGINLFVDSGELWESSGKDFAPGGFKVTPGLGVQMMTPLGPMRVDAAYDGYAPQRGRLYLIQGQALNLANPDFAGPGRGSSFLSKIQYHFSVGLAF